MLTTWRIDAESSTMSNVLATTPPATIALWPALRVPNDHGHSVCAARLVLQRRATEPIRDIQGVRDGAQPPLAGLRREPHPLYRSLTAGSVRSVTHPCQLIRPMCGSASLPVIFGSRPCRAGASRCRRGCAGVRRRAGGAGG